MPSREISSYRDTGPVILDPQNWELRKPHFSIKHPDSGILLWQQKMNQPTNIEREMKQSFVPCGSPSGADRYSVRRTVGSRETGLTKL